MNIEKTPNNPQVDAGLLAILACPESHQPLRHLTPNELQELNLKISQRTLMNIAGIPVEETWVSGLIREDKQRAYEIRGGLPILLIEAGVVP